MLLSLNIEKIFNNKVIWIVGASSGIGAALATLLASCNAKLILSSRNVTALETIKTTLGKGDNHCYVLPLDLENIDSFANISSLALSHFGGIDYVFFNGGISQRALGKDTPMALDRKLMEINYFSYVALTKLLLPHFIQKGNGHIVVTSSIAGKIGFHLRTAYASSKHALHGYFDSLRLELHHQGVFITLVCPGKINTAISMNALTASMEKFALMDNSQLQGMSAEKCAQKIIAAVIANKREIIIGNRENFGHLLQRFVPNLFYKLLLKQKVE